MRGRMALDASGIAVEHREILLRDKPAEMLAASPKGTVPVVVLPEGRVIEESLDVMLWALGQNDPENWLSPPSGDRSEMDALIAANDGPFKHHLDRYKYDTRYEGAVASDHRTIASAHLQDLDDRLDRSDQLLGDRPSLADIALFPFVRQFANTDRDWFDAQPWPNLQRWLDGHLQSERFERIMQKYALFVSQSAP